MMLKTKKIWFNGEFVDWDRAEVHFLTHTFHYGGGVFEGIRFYKTKEGPAVFRLSDHIKRFFYSARVIEMDLPFSPEEIEKAILGLIKINKVEEGYIRPLAFFGYGKMGLDPKGAPVKIAIALWPWESYLGGKPVKVKISSFARLHPHSTVIKAKICGHYVNSILATQEAKRKGYDEALLLDYKGMVAEGPGENIFFVRGGELVTPALGSILPGLTRATIFDLASDRGVKVREKELAPEEALKSEEAFFVGTAAEVCPISQIDDVSLGSGQKGSLTKKLQEDYQKLVHGEIEKYQSWLSFVSDYF